MQFFNAPESQAKPASMKKSLTNGVIKTLLRFVAFNFNIRPSLRPYLKSDLGWIDFTAGFRTRNGSTEAAIRFKNGKVSVISGVPKDLDVSLVFTSDQAIMKLLKSTPTEQVFMLLKNELYTEGNASYLNLFFFYLSLLINKMQIKQMRRERKTNVKYNRGISGKQGFAGYSSVNRSSGKRLKAETIDSGVKILEEPYLSAYSIDDFPRLKAFLTIHFQEKPEVCPELPQLTTNWFKENGFEYKQDGTPWNPVLRKALSYKYMMTRKKPVIRKNDLLAGATTTREIGVIVYPEGHGTMIWGELLTVPHRTLNPYNVSKETIRILHHDVFPFWAERNFKEWVRKKYNNPLGQRIDERFAVYFDWKQVTISHTIPDFKAILEKGAIGIIGEIEERLNAFKGDEDKAAHLEAMKLCLEGLVAYSKNLSVQAESEAAAETDPIRKKELKNLARICGRIIEHPAETLEEAVNAIWITWIGLHMESTNAGLSLGRLDQLFQPYFESDAGRLKSEKDKKAYVEYAIELIGCLFMRCTDHLPLTPDIANFYFGGSSSDQAITVGGVTPQGDDAVNDMTYIILKVTEILGIRDPNVNARYNLEKNSDVYLKRLCEVNLITAATPSMHNDDAVMTSLQEFQYPIEHLRDWAATGCVEPTITGRHMGHTGSQMMNMVAALEMAMNNGLHPLMNWKVGPDTGHIEKGNFETFEDFYRAFCEQFRFLIENSIEFNNMLGKAHQDLRPTPLLSSLLDGCVETGLDATHGGARYNTTGAALIGLVDVADSLMSIKKLVFDEKRLTFWTLKKAVDSNFKNDPVLRALTLKKIPRFGSGNDEAAAMANRVAGFAHDCYGSHVNYRGGKYTTGFWSMSNHVAFGTLSGALPSGKQAGKAFTPGLTPSPDASKSLLDNLRDVARLDPRNMNNNIAFNVKVVPGPNDSYEQTIENMFYHVKTYFKLGGMQMQMNVVTSDTLKDAMNNPENYRNLLVRISGYNAYFVTLNRDMQIELIERAEYGV